MSCEAMDLTEESMKGRRYRRRHLSMTVLLCIIIALLTAALLLAAYVISKLERNNLFSKSVFLGNNYFLGELSGESGESESQSQDSMTARAMSNLEKQLLAEAVFDAGDYPYGDDMVKAAEDAYYGMDNSVGSTTKTIKAMTAQTKIGTTSATATTAEAVKVTTVRAAAIKAALTARLRVHMALLRAEAIPKNSAT